MVTIPRASNFFDKEKNITTEGVETTIKENLNPEALEEPKIFSWDNLVNTFKDIPNPLNPLESGPSYTLRKLLEEDNPEFKEKYEKKLKEAKYTGWLDELRKAINVGQARIAYSIADLALTGVDISFDKSTTKKLEELYENLDIEEPESTFGQMSAILVEYGLPGSAVLKIMNRIKNVSRSKKINFLPKNKFTTVVKRVAKPVAKPLGFGAAGFITDFIASGPDAPLPFREDKLIDTSNLEGRELAKAKLKNRVLYGVEGATIAGAIPLLGKPLGLAAKYGIGKPLGLALKTVDTVVISPVSYLLSKDPIVIPTISKAIKKGGTAALLKGIAPVAVKGISVLSKQTKAPFTTKLPDFKDWRVFSVQSANPLKANLKKLDNFLSYFRSLGKQTAAQGKITRDAELMIKGKSRAIDKYLDSIEKKTYDMVKGFAVKYDKKNTPEMMQEYYLDMVLSYLKGQTRALPKEIRPLAAALKKELDETKKTFGDLLPEGDLKKFILDDISGYMRKSFAVFTNPYYKPPKKLLDISAKYIKNNVVLKNKDLIDDAIEARPDLTRTEAIEEYSKILVKDILEQGKVNGRDPLATLQYINKDILRSDEILKTGEELPGLIKSLLGEENNFRSTILQTVGDTVTATTNNMMYKQLANIGLKEGWLFKSKSAARASGMIGEIKSIGRVPGQDLFGNPLTYVDEAGNSGNVLYAADDIAQALMGTNSLGDKLLKNSWYNAVLSLKAGTQFGKTVLSPSTQVRNITSASFQPLMNGHIGGKGSVLNAFEVIFDDIFGAGKAINEEELIKNIQKKIELGVLDENIVSTELTGILKDIRSSKISKTGDLLERITNMKGVNLATKIYAGGDNVWKWYGHEYVKSQLSGIFKNLDDVKKWTREITGKDYVEVDPFTGKVKELSDAIEEAAGWYINNTYATYSMVPPAITQLRKLPVGNFIAFPAEMMRTSFNVLDIGLKEISSNNSKIREMGYRRLMGAFAALGGANMAVQKISSSFTGVSKEDMDDYSKNIGAPWEDGKSLYAISKPKDGKFKYINGSYFNMYDVVQSPFRSLFKIFKDRKNIPVDARSNILNEIITGPIFEIVKPFISEAIALERIQDVAIAGVGIGGRGGRTKTGSYVYSPSDSFGEIAKKSFFHIARGIEPGAVSSGRRVWDSYTKRKDYDPLIEMVNLFGGVRINEANISKTLDFIITDFTKIQSDVYKSESFYSAEDWPNRGPSEMINDFIQIQDEAYKEQFEIYQAIQAAKKFDLTDRDIMKIFDERDISGIKIRNLIKGYFTPITFSEGALLKKIKNLKDIEKRRGIEIFTKEKNRRYYAPFRELDRIIRSYDRKKFDVEIEKKEQKTSQNVNVPVEKPIQTAEVEIQTPPLNTTTDNPNINPATNLLASINPTTNLTKTEEALLSPTDKIIRQNQRTV